jgi:tetratricopeptide (TPR) repeat protein
MGFLTSPFGIAKRVLGFLYENVSKVVFLGVVVVLLYFVFADRTQPLLTLSSFAASKAVEDHGLNGDIIVGRLKTALVKITDNDSADAHTAERVLSFRNPTERCQLEERVRIGDKIEKPAPNAFDSLADSNLGGIDIEIPGTGMSLPQVQRILRQLTGSRDIVVSGDLMMIDDKAGDGSITTPKSGVLLTALGDTPTPKNPAVDDLMITVRVSGLGDLKILRATARTADIDPSIEVLARQLARLVDPIALARYYIERCNITAADGILETCLRPDSRLCDDRGKAEARALQGLVLLYSSDFERATASLELAITGPLDRHEAAKAYFYLALGRYFQYRLDAALDATEHAIALDPTGFDARYVRSFLLVYQSRRTEGRLLLENLIIDQIDNLLQRPESRVPELSNALQTFWRLRTVLAGTQTRPVAIDEDVRAARQVDVMTLTGDASPILTDVSDLQGSVADYAQALDELRQSLDGLSYFLSVHEEEKSATASNKGQYEVCFGDRDTSAWPVSRLVYCSLYADDLDGIEWSTAHARVLLNDARVRDLHFQDDPELWLMSGILRLTYDDADDLPGDIDGGLLDDIVSDLKDDSEYEKYHWFLGVAYLHRFYVTADQSDLHAALDELDAVPEKDPAASSAKIVAGYARALEQPCAARSESLSDAPTVSQIHDTLGLPLSAAHMLRGMILACYGQADRASQLFHMAARDLYDEKPQEDGMSAIVFKCSAPDEVCRTDADFRQSLKQSLEDVAKDPTPWLTLNDGLVRYSLAQALYRTGDKAAALSLADLGTRRKYARVAILQLLFQADGYAEQGREDKARDLLVSWLHMYGQNADIMARLGRLQIAMADNEAAEETLESAAYQKRLQPIQPGEVFSEGDILFDLGRAVAAQASTRTGEAVDLYRAGLDKNDHGSAEQYQMVIDAYCALGRLDDARRFRADTVTSKKVTAESALRVCPASADFTAN